MKRIYLSGLLLLIITTTTLAQTGRVFHLDKLSKQDTLLSGWVFHTGDHAEWRQPGFDDKNWKTVDPGIDVAHFTALKDAGTGWLRIHIRLGSSLANRMLAISITQYTASEIYLNGALLIKYGTISSDQSKIEGYLPSKEPFVIKLDPDKDNVIAVRIAYQRGLPYLSSLFEPLSAFALHINNYPSAVASFNDYSKGIKNFVIVFGLFGGMVLIVFFTYMVYFLFDRNKKIYLYYALFCFCICYITLPNEVYGIDRFGPLATEMWAVYAEGSAFVLGMIFLLLTIYTVFGYQRRVIFSVLCVIGAITVTCMFFNGTTFFFFNTSIIPLLFMFEGVHVCMWAIKQKKKDAVYVLAGTVCFVTLIAVSAFLDQGTIFSQLLWGAGIVCFPLGMAFYLGIQSSITNRQLEASLVEVQTLSAQKQQILADQNILLEQQVAERTAELNQSLTNLKATQTQLIQSEKMASLGELTAGIAHEIQNPLNFVNNFSEVNREMLEELKAESEKPKAERNGQLEIGLIHDLIENEQKINHHGKRADSIVKGMLEHSRASSGQKELTDINALAEEYMRLSYHGLRAKDKTFNSAMELNLDSNVPTANVVPQDIGRVLLNLFNNAFYAVNQKQKTGGDEYKPEVSVSTSTESDHVVIKVKDNGTGIPENIKDKIMQPFFTTKPTGEGTGLGLSLSYDIVVKGHGGSINIESEENKGSEFTISIPVS